MAGTLAVLACVVSLGAAIPAGPGAPSFRFNYHDGISPGGGVAQFYSGADSAFIYNWGYQYPGQSHTESKTHDGNVKGNYKFVDANGVLQQTSYSAGPVAGFTVDSEQQQVPVVAPAQVYSPQVVAVPNYASALVANDGNTQSLLHSLASQGIGLDLGSRQAIERASPQLLAAVRSGFLEPLRGGANEIVFKVSNSLVDQTRGSVSALADYLDTDVVAARHDQQIVRNPTAGFYSAPQVPDIRAILETEILEDGPRYVVRVPYF